MGNQYQLNLEQYSLRKFKGNLASRDMIPSREILKEDLDKHFAILEDQGISNLKELINKLNTKARIAGFSAATGLSIQYLTLLKREASSYRKNPIRIDKFPGIEPQYIHRLAAAGVRNTRQVFDLAKCKKERAQLAESVDIPIDIMTELVSLSDLVRAHGVGPVFARMLFDAGIKTIQEFVSLSAEDLIRIYEETQHKKADFGVNEIQFCLELAKELDIAVEL